MYKAVIIIILFICSILNAQVFPVKTIMESGSRSNRINVVFLGDGYKSNEMEKYLSDVQKTTDKLFEESPYKEYKNLFNVYAVEVPSVESGTSHPGTASASECGIYKDSVIYRKTYFGTTFDKAGTHRLLVADSTGKIFQVLQNNLPDYDMVFMVVNHNWYGGSGGWISVFSTNTQSAEIAIHEAGHSFANLGDEYYYGTNTVENPQFEGVNYTWKTDRNQIPWKDWILDSTPIPTPNSYTNIIGLFEGAFYQAKGMYRPKYNCKMKSLYVPFCEVCKEQHVKSIFNLVDVIESKTPNQSTVDLYKNGSADFFINTPSIYTGALKVIWSLDGKIIAEDKAAVSLSGSTLENGIHTLKVDAAHSSELVRNDPNKLLSNTVSWNVNVLNATDVEENSGAPQKFSLEQNFPNPFNPSTVIRYNLASAGFVSIKIYDLLGREVAVLVNEYKHAGSYSKTFSAEYQNLSGGVYFYKLSIGNFSEIKKMIYLK